MILRVPLGVAAGVLVALAAQPALAQAINSNPASYNAGYGRTPGQEFRGTQFGSRDAEGNRLIIDGIIMQDTNFGVGGSSSASAGASASASAGAGVGASASGMASAVGNNLTVITQGNYNTVIVNSTQINTGTVTATTNAQGGN